MRADPCKEAGMVWRGLESVVRQFSVSLQQPFSWLYCSQLYLAKLFFSPGVRHFLKYGKPGLFSDFTCCPSPFLFPTLATSSAGRSSPSAGLRQLPLTFRSLCCTRSTRASTEATGLLHSSTLVCWCQPSSYLMFWYIWFCREIFELEKIQAGFDKITRNFISNQMYTCKSLVRTHIQAV